MKTDQTLKHTANSRYNLRKIALISLLSISYVIPTTSYALKEEEKTNQKTTKVTSQLLAVGSQQHQDAITLDWIDLVPQKEREQFDEIGMPIIDHNNINPEQNRIGGVRPELNGTKVKIPGFVIPLEGDDRVLTEFLLVPYFGACVHVPPPPANQIIYVKFKQGVPVQELWDVIYVIGTLKTELLHHDLADTAYIIDGIALAEYDDGAGE